MIEELFSNSQVKVGNFVFQKAAKVFASSLALNKKKKKKYIQVTSALTRVCYQGASPW